MTDPEVPSIQTRGRRAPGIQNGLTALAAMLASAALVRLLLRRKTGRLQQDLPTPPALDASAPVVLVDPAPVVPVVPAPQAQNNAAPLPPPVPRRRPPLDTFSLTLLLMVVIAGTAGFIRLIQLAGMRLALVPIQNIAAYSIFRPADLTTGTAPKFRLMRVSSSVYRASVHSDADLLNHYVRAPLPAGKPFARSLLQPAGSAPDTVAVAVPATDALLLGGTVRPGDSVDLLVTPASAGTAGAAHPVPPNSVAFTALTVLDVRRGGESIASPGAESESLSRTGSAVLVLALPSSRATEFASLLPHASLFLSVHR